MKAVALNLLVCAGVFVLAGCNRETTKGAGGDQRDSGDGRAPQPIMTPGTASKPSGALVLNSIPSDVEYELIGPPNLTIRQGRTPRKEEGLEPGLYRAIFRQSGYVGQRYAVSVGSELKEVTGDFKLQAEWHKLRDEVVAQDAEIATGYRIQNEVGPKLLTELGTISLRNEAMKRLLSKHGYDVKVTGTPSETGVQNSSQPDTPSKNEPTVDRSKTATTPKETAAPSSRAPYAGALSFELASVAWTSEVEKSWTDGIAFWQKAKADREVRVKASKELQEKLQAMCMDLVELAKTDSDGAQVVERFEIKVGPPKESKP